jgi:poly-gamma-glutamate capsule biosynthesis protein CapA/YwtB (metallophosphatase superfamily)
MNSDSPSTPAEALQISAALRFTMNAVCKSAELFGYWDRPYQGAATNFEEMSLLDKFYWVYKCRRPVVRMEGGERIDTLICTDSGIVRVPDEFKEQGRITFGAVGDLIQAEGLEGSRDELYGRIADLLFDQTISYANLESPLTEQAVQEEVISDKEAPIECCSKEQFDILKGHEGRNFTVMHTAGNHMFDMGAEGIQTTLKQFQRDGIVDVGTNRIASERGQGRIVSRDGVKVGFASATYGLNGHELPAGEEFRINVARMLPKRGEPDLDILKQQIDDCRENQCDFIVASLHWGYEFEFFPRKRQIDIAHTIVEWGADAIIGHHPHVVQPVEFYRTRRDPGRVAVIAYSLGSLTWGFSAPHLVLSAVLNFTVAKGTRGDKTMSYIQSAGVTPVFRSRTSSNGSLVTRIEKLADAVDPNQADYIAEIRRYAGLVLGARASMAG